MSEYQKQLISKLKSIGSSEQITILDQILIHEHEATEVINLIIKDCETITGRTYYHPRIRLNEDRPKEINKYDSDKKDIHLKHIIEALETHGTFHSQNDFALYLTTHYGYSQATAKRAVINAWATGKIVRKNQIIDGKITYQYMKLF